ncbi:gp436 family protein [Acinetobacter sp. BSP-28]|uniref:gp436 family protein n=1 Tax=Acinetobacter sp. BSP-28 TaxID=3344661 RepID=UPI00377070ED
MYATESDLVARFGGEIENLKTMLPSQSSVTDAIQDATEEINGHIGGRYPLPLPNVPSNLKRMACDIARYRLYFQQPTEEVRKRYEDAIAFLKRVADNKAHLQILLPETNQIVDDQPKNKPSTVPIGTSYTGGVFGDDTLNKMPGMK